VSEVDEIEFAPGLDFHEPDPGLDFGLHLATPEEDEPIVRTDSHSWTPIDLLAIESAKPEPPTIGHLVYPGRRHVFSGEPESLKTWAANALCAEQTRAGRNVIYVDFEMGAREQLERFRDLALTDDEIRRIVYVAPSEPLTDPKGRPSPHLQGDLAALLAAREPSLVIFDAFTGALELHGADPNSGVEVERFYRTVIAPFQARGAGVVLLDHLTKNKDSRGRYSIGSERKLGGADVHLGFELVRSFGRGKTGLARISTHKDRPGHLPRPRAAELELASDADTGRVSWTIRPGEDRSDREQFRPTALMERVSRYCEACVEPTSRNTVEKGVGGNATYTRQAMEVLVAEKYLDEQPGERNARLLTSLKPYRQDEDEHAH
jgi:hypothetical protein